MHYVEEKESWVLMYHSLRKNHYISFPAHRILKGEKSRKGNWGRKKSLRIAEREETKVLQNRI